MCGSPNGIRRNRSFLVSNPKSRPGKSLGTGRELNPHRLKLNLQQKNSEDALEDHHQQQYINNDDDDEPADISTELIEGFLINHPKLFARLVEQFNLDDFESGNEVAEDANGRTKRRVSVFNNVYQKCRIQKRREKNLCLYLANLYQNLKGFHGL